MSRATEKTAMGEQILTEDVRPVTLRDRLQLRIAQPIRPKRNPNIEQKPCDVGLFDSAARDQLDLVDFIRAAQRTPANQTKET